MNHVLLALAFQEGPPTDSSMWIVVAGVLLVLFFIVVIIGVALTIFFIARKRSKAQQTSAGPAVSVSSMPSSYSPALQEADSAPVEADAAFGSPSPEAMEAEAAVAADAPGSHREETVDFDPTRTVAIVREPAPTVSYGSIKFISGVLTGQEFEVNADGAFIGRDETLSQIVVADPRISKRHLWIGVREGAVTIVDQDSRNGTFVNDPRADRVTEATLNSGDTVIMGESDVARFEYLASTISPV